jgi:hypothetical protein
MAGLLVLCTACAGRLEQHLLRGYFDACAVGDRVALANVALVWLHPAEDGVVGRFDVVRISPRVERPRSDNPEAIRLSLLDGQEDYDEARARLVEETVDVAAEIHLGGELFRRELSVTLARAETPDAVGRWIVVRLAPGGRTLRAASSARP